MPRMLVEDQQMPPGLATFQVPRTREAPSDKQMHLCGHTSHGLLCTVATQLSSVSQYEAD